MVGGGAGRGKPLSVFCNLLEKIISYAASPSSVLKFQSLALSLNETCLYASKAAQNPELSPLLPILDHLSGALLFISCLDLTF